VGIFAAAKDLLREHPEMPAGTMVNRVTDRFADLWESESGLRTPPA